MINVYLNQVEKELDQLLLAQKEIHDKLRVKQDTYSAIEDSENKTALRIFVLYTILQHKSELHSLNTRIDAAKTAIKELHRLRQKDKEDTIYERSVIESQQE